MSVSWPDILVHHPAKHADSTVRAATEKARAPDSRAATGMLYSPSSPRHAPLAAAHALRARQASSSAHESRSASAGQKQEHSAQEPKEMARSELQSKLDSLARARSGALSTSATKADASKRRRPREPQASPAPADDHPKGGARHATHPPRQPRKGKVYCGQNKLDPSLRVNGGTLEVGTRSRCFRSGFGAALHQHIGDEAAFIRKFTAPYAPLVAQKLWYKDSPPPQDHQPATLSQARQRGFGAGSASLARKLQQKLPGQSKRGARSTGARPASAPSPP